MPRGKSGKKKGGRNKKKGGRSKGGGGSSGAGGEPGNFRGAISKMLPVIKFPNVNQGISGNSNLPYRVSNTLNGRRAVTYIFEMPLAIVTTASDGTQAMNFQLVPASLPKWATYMGGGTPLFGLGRCVAVRAIWLPIVGITIGGRVAAWWDYSAAAPSTNLSVTQIQQKQGYKECLPYQRPGAGGVVLPWRPTNITDENWIQVTDTVFKPNGDVDVIFMACDGCPAAADLGYWYIQYALEFQETVN